MSNEENVCRLCLKNVPCSYCTPLDTSILDKFKLILPDLELIPSINPVICNTCKESLEESHKLKRTCSSSNKLIGFLKNYSGVSHAVDLKELIKGSNKRDENLAKNEHVCRICLKSNECDYKTIENVKAGDFASILEPYLSALEEDLTLNPLICEICVEALHKMCSFIRQFSSVEDKVKSYHKSHPTEKVDISKVLEAEMDQKQSCAQEKDKDASNKDAENRKRSSAQEVGEESMKKLKLDHKLNTEAEDEDDELAFTEQNTPSKANINELPYFDFSIGILRAPYRRTIYITEWLKQANAVKAKLKWSDSTAKSKVLEMMRRLWQAHSWFSSVADVTTWKEFTDKLVHAFPERDDFYFKIIKMVDRKKKHTETYEEYFHGKLDTLKPFNFSEEQEVSCLLGGISDISANCSARIGKYRTREEVLKYLKSCDEKFTNYPMKPTGSLKTGTEAAGTGFFHNLPKKNLIVVLENKRLDVPMYSSAGKDGPKQNGAHPDTSNQTCSCCDQKGHTSVNCPLVKPNKIPTIERTDRTKKAGSDRDRSRGNLIVLHENETIPSENPAEIKQSPNVTETVKPEESNVGIDKPQQHSTPKANPTQKCACCDKLGHSSVDCPLIKGKTTENVSRKDTPTAGKCSFCDNTGHSSLVCPLIDCDETTPPRSNIKIVLDKDRLDAVGLPSGTVSSVKEDFVLEVAKNTVQKKCSCCDKTGHTSLDCPLIGLNREGKQKKCPLCHKMGHKTRHCPLNVINRAKEAKVVVKAAVNDPFKWIKSTETKRLSANTAVNKAPKMDARPEKSALVKFVSGGIQANDTPKAVPKATVTQTTREWGNSPRPGHSSANRSNMAVGKASEAVNRAETPANPPYNKTGDWKHERVPAKLTGGTNKAKDTLKAVPKATVTQAQHEWVSSYQSEDSSAKSSTTAVDEAPTFTKTDKRTGRSRRCLCCNQHGHSSLDCPLLAGKTDDQPEQNQEKARRHDPMEGSANKQENCSLCNKPGHASTACTFHNFFSVNNPERKQKSQSVSDKRQADSQPSIQTRTQTVLADQKCCFCDKRGHSSIDCFRARFEEKHQSAEANKPQSESRHAVSEYQGAPKCEFCNKVGHRLADCFLARFDRKIYDAHSNAGSSSSRQCLYCGKFGHLQPDCPKSKVPPRSTLATSFQKRFH